jgi:hypothetical protein
MVIEVAVDAERARRGPVASCNCDETSDRMRRAG